MTELLVLSMLMSVVISLAGAAVTMVSAVTIRRAMVTNRWSGCATKPEPFERVEQVVEDMPEGATVEPNTPMGERDRYVLRCLLFVWFGLM